MLIFRTGVSCFSVTLFYSALFCCGGKAILVQFTLFYSSLLTLTDRRTDTRRNKYTRFAWAGGTCPRFAWAGGTFFPVVLLCQFLVLAGNRFWLYIVLCTWSTIRLWCCVSFFGSGGKCYGGKKSSSRLSGGLCCCVSFWFWQLRPEKKF